MVFYYFSGLLKFKGWITPSLRNGTIQSNLDYPDLDYPDFFSGPVFFMNINKL